MHRSMEKNSPEIEPCIYDQLIFNRCQGNSIGKKKSSTNNAGITGCPYGKKQTLTLTSHHMQN